MKRGFTLIELMIVVAIIAIIAAIAIPNLLQSRLLSNESAAMGALKTIHTEMNKFKQANYCMKAGANDMNAGAGNESSFATQLIYLYQTQIVLEDGTPKEINLISRALAQATTSANAYKGYVFFLDGDGATPDKNSFRIIAVPAVYGKTGIKTFYIDEEGTIYSRDFEGEDTLVIRDEGEAGTNGAFDFDACAVAGADTWPSTTAGAANWVAE